MVDDLLAAGYSRITVLDVSGVALSRARGRLGDAGKIVQRLEADITQTTPPPDSFDVWHDRALFHFLTDPAARSRYVSLCEQALKPGGTLVVATFARMGPAVAADSQPCGTDPKNSNTVR